MNLNPKIAVSGFVLSLLAACAWLTACRSQSSNLNPAISFTQIPRADQGGPDKTDTIAGRADGFKPHQRIVLYARASGMWWIQPFADHPFTNIQDDASWKASIHLGQEYAALLVNPGYVPPGTADILPPVGAGVVAVTTVKGKGLVSAATPARTIHFSGYDWEVRSTIDFRGGSRNEYDPANVWTDDSGALHLRIAKKDGRWTCAQVRLARSLGYGTYTFVVRDTDHLEPSAVMTLFTWDELGTEQNRRELDVEIGRWGYVKNENAHYVVQPYYIPANLNRFVVPAGKLIHSFRWEPGEVTFSTVSASRSHPVNQHVFTSGVPSAGGDLVHINLYNFALGEIPLKNDNEVVIEKFEFLP